MIKKILNKLSEYPRLRVLLFIVGIIVLLFVISHLFSSHVETNPIPPSSIMTGNVNPNQPALAPTGQYQNLAQQEQKNQEQQAASSGQSFFTGLFSGQAPNAPAQTQQQVQAAPVSPENFYQHQAQGQQQNQATTQTGGYMSNLLSSNLGTQLPTSTQNNQHQVLQLTNSMNQQLQSLTKDWKLPTGNMVQGAQPAASTAPVGLGGPKSVIIKAGTIYYAVLDTALNSDQSSTPVMATIVNGPYKGAKLLGKFERVEDKLVVQFGTMSLSSQADTIGIGTAYAIDGTTAQNALATNVDNHYLLRYGSLFAASFMQGFGNAYSNNNYGAYCSPGSTCNITPGQNNNNPPATSTALYQGIGQVGTALSAQVATNFNRAPTVTLDQGTGMGILFMNDVKI